MLDKIFPDLKRVECYRCGGYIFNHAGPSVEKVQFIQDGELVDDEVVYYDYTCKECGLTFSE
jgi:DNA-directed RNA polymerase subunit RPC12/RpoP